MTRWSRIGSVGGVLATVGLGGCLGFGQDRGSHRILDEGPISRADIDIDAGTVTLTGNPSGAGVTGSIDSRWTDASPEIVHYVEDGVLHVLGRCSAIGLICKMDVTLNLPTNANIGVRTGRGDVSVKGIRGDLEVNTGQGDVALEDVDGSLVVETAAGDVDGRGVLSHLVDVRTTEGDIDLELLAAPSRTDARTEDGDVTLTVPAGTYRIETSTQNGDIAIADNLLHDPNATNVIVAESRRGDIDLSGGAQSKTYSKERSVRK